MRKGKIAIGLLISLLMSMLAFAFTIQPVKASETVYIRDDGSVENTNKILRDGEVYTLTDNISSSIVVERDNIVVDGAGYILQETESYPVQRAGIDLSASYNVTITGTEIKSFSYGIRLQHSHDNIISGNNLEYSEIYLEGSSGNIISGNRVVNGGITLDGSSDNIVSGNYINNTLSQGDGIRVEEYSARNTIFGNYITNSFFGIYFSGFVFEPSNNIVLGNHIADNTYGIGLSESSNNILYHNNFVNNMNPHLQYDDQINVWDNGYPSGGNYWSGHICTGNPSNGTQPYVMNANNADRYPFQDPSGWPPTIFVLSHQNKFYTGGFVSLTFAVDQATSWIGYSIDGQTNTTVSGNTIQLTLSGLSDGPHSLVVFSSDTGGNVGHSDPFNFSVDTTLPIVTIDPVALPKDKFRLIDRVIYQRITGTFVEVNIDRILVDGWSAEFDRAAGTYSGGTHVYWGDNLLNVTAVDLSGKATTVTIIIRPTGALFEEYGLWVGIFAGGIALVPLPLALKRRRALTSDISALNFEQVSVGRRFLAYVIDQIIFSVIFITLDRMVFPALHLAPSLFALTRASLNEFDALLQVTTAVVGIVGLFGLIYYILMEGCVGSTIGKLALNVRVVGEDGASCGLGSAYIRNLTRFVDEFPYVIPYLLGVISISKSSKRQRLGDRIAKTIAVKRT